MEGEGGDRAADRRSDGSLRESLRRIARRVQSHPHNERGTDKTWVLRSMWSALVFREQARRAERVERT